jgi:hypothetical protein
MSGSRPSIFIIQWGGLFLTMLVSISINAYLLVVLNKDINQIEQQQVCFATFFAQPGAIRTQASITVLKACQPTVQKVQR